MIELPSDSRRDREMWETLLDLAEEVPTGWTIIGSQMVMLHALEHDRLTRVSIDFDVVVDVRKLRRGTERVSTFLLGNGFELELSKSSHSQINHWFVRNGVEADVLMPDGVGSRSKGVTVPPFRTIEVPGGTQALTRTEWIDVRLKRRRGRLPRPNLLGAIVIKAAAIGVDDAPDSQVHDLALLLSLIEAPRALAQELSSKERALLRAGLDSIDTHPLAVATALPAETERLRARQALKLLCAGSPA